MKKYIILLRGINVSGQKKILMADLRELLNSSGFGEVQTYIQSGNIIIASEATAENVSEKIQKKVFEEYKFEVKVFVLTPQELQQTVEENPFAADETKDVSRTYVTFLEEQPKNTEALKGFKFPEEEFVLKGRSIYFYSPNSYGRAKMNNNFFEKKLGLQATTRNWRTITKLIEMVGEI